MSNRKAVKTYTATIEIDVRLSANSMVVDNPESVAAAVRSYMRAHLPTNMTKGGYSFCTSAIHAEAKAKEEARNE